MGSGQWSLGKKGGSREEGVVAGGGGGGGWMDGSVGLSYWPGGLNYPPCDWVHK